VLSEDDIRAVRDSQASSPILTWDTWSEDSIKKAVVVALTPWLVGDPRYREDIACALAQTWVCFIHPYSLGVEEVYC